MLGVSARHVIGLFALALPLAAGAEVAPGDEASRWIPSLAIHTGLLAEDASARSFAGPVLGPVLSTTPQLIRPSASGDGTLLAALVGTSLELMTPRLSAAYAEPRLFLHAGAAATFGSPKNLAREGSYGPLGPPPVLETTFFGENTIVGQGTQTEAQSQRWIVSAGGGVAISVDWFGFRLRIKPSIEYLREVVRLEGVTNRAVLIHGTSGNVFADTSVAILLSQYDDRVRQIELAGAETKAYHGVGPGLELETDVERFGPFIWSVFASGKATAFIGNLEFATNATNQFGEVAGWNFEKDRWAYRANVGLRFRWLPE